MPTNMSLWKIDLVIFIYKLFIRFPSLADKGTCLDRTPFDFHKAFVFYASDILINKVELPRINKAHITMIKNCLAEISQCSGAMGSRH